MAESAARRGDPAPEAVLRLASNGGGEPFLAPHHLEAARRLARLFNRARMMQRVTMSYDAARIGGRSERPRQGELADSAIEARRLLNALARRMPRDCWDMLTDICGFDKGLQQIELDRGWPRRSAKLVLRIGLEQLAVIMGLTELAAGRGNGSMRAWLPERPPMFPEPAN
ncbi:DUF6456 domain-containing protein [Devosia sp. YIM 151766]|uniref:DUF6456 domain-containing protein n=1 Tax=Devosia sp. YIM 151766 TaxID=3017325 RepID=UPI00255C53B3|nr:DUF6456 domain-containing protein [Devosia sp. YIM 151766]WIY53644.1 DUF6456 domain-containing protein [Devosia sp. YIM 151766]